MALLEMRESDLYAAYDDFLDEVHERVFICGFEYSPSLALMRIDRVAYNCGFNDWLDHEVAEGALQEVDGKYFRCY